MPKASLARQAVIPAIALAILLAGCSAGTAATTPIASNPLVTTAPPTLAPLVTVAPSPSGPGGAIREGKYAATTTQVADMEALINADTKLTSAQRDHVHSDFGFNGYTTSRIYVDLHGGQWTERGSYDGAPPEVGARATYAFPDDHTVVIQESGHGQTTFQVTWNGPSFTLKVLSATNLTEYDIVENHLVYEWAPFTPVP